MTTAYQKSIDDLAETLARTNPGFDLRKYNRLIATDQGDTVKIPSKKTVKKLRRSSKGIVAKAAARNSLAGAAGRAERQALDRIAQLEREVKKSGGGQSSWGSAFELARLQASVGAYGKIRKAAVADFNDFASVDRYMANPAANERNASRAATASAISSAQGDSINAHLGRKTPLDVMNDILNDSGQPETVQDFEVQTRKLEKQLADAQTPAERESLGYRITRRKLLAMHARGEG